MSRLNQKAYKILLQEIQHIAALDPFVGTMQQEIVIKRLEKLRTQPGKPAHRQEIEILITDMLPSFSPQILAKAAKANKNTPLAIKLFGFSMIGLTGLGSLIWLANLPYPMIRRPIARTAPILLLPSYISMDRNYRQAIAHIEQADQLVNQATTKADILLGEEKVKLAQQNLDELPVWFLGYEPVAISSFYNFGWKFTFDEFEKARANVGRMEAKIFQEKNSITQLEQAETNIQQAKQQYQQSPNPQEKETAKATWQDGLDRLKQIPPGTLAAKKAHALIAAYERDLQHISEKLAESDRSNKLISAAKQFAQTANTNCNNPPYSTTQWQQCQDLWQQAIQRLNQIKLEDAEYLESQNLLTKYQTNLDKVTLNLKTETDSAQALENAQNLTERLLASIPSKPQPPDYNTIKLQLQSIINQLEKVQPKTTAYESAQSLLKSAQDKLRQY